MTKPETILDVQKPYTLAEVYETLGEKNYCSIKTLAWFAREDRKEDYDKWHKEWCRKAFRAAFGYTASSNEMGIAAAKYFWLEYTYSHIKGGADTMGWWRFDLRTGRWESGASAALKLERDMLDRFRTELEAYRNTEIINSSRMNHQEQQVSAAMEKIISKAITNLGEEAKYRKVIKMMSLRMHCEHNLLAITDTNKHITGHNNGVWDVIDARYILPGELHCDFRPHRPEDYVTLTTGHHFNKHMGMNNSIVKSVMYYKNQLFRDPEIMRFSLDVDASVIYGGNRDKILTLRVGTKGNNSKSMHQRLLKVTFGASYFVEITTSVLTSKPRESGKADPEQARMRTARLVVAFEPERTEVVNTSVAKGFTGSDDRYVRTLYSEGGGMEQLYKLTVFANHDVRVTEADQAIKQRMIVIPYESRWQDVDVPDDPVEQMRLGIFKLDPDFENRVRSWGAAYAYILWNQFNTRYRSLARLQVPDVIRRVTNEYWSRNDIYEIFARRHLQVGSGRNVSLQDLYKTFKRFYQDGRYAQDIPDIQTVASNMEARFGQMVTENFMNVGLKQTASAAFMSGIPGGGGFSL